jgi:hypothetical protein
MLTFDTLLLLVRGDMRHALTLANARGITATAIRQDGGDAILRVPACIEPRSRNGRESPDRGCNCFADLQPERRRTMNGKIDLYRAPNGLVGLDALVPEHAGFGMLAKMLADPSARVFCARQFDQGGPIMFEPQVLPDALDAVLAEGAGGDRAG